METGPPGALKRTTVVPTCDDDGHSAIGIGFTSVRELGQRALRRSGRVPTKPGGRSTNTSFTPSTGNGLSTSGAQDDRRVESIVVEIAYGCPPACENGSPNELAVTAPSNASTQKPAATDLSRIDSFAFLAPPRPRPANSLIKVPRAFPSTVALSRS